MKINKFNKPSGKLEVEIMEIIWKLDSVSVRDVFNQLKKRRKIAYTTVMTIMTRLFEKGILKRKLNTQGAYIYVPRQSKDDFLLMTSKKAINNLIKEFGEVAVAQFIDLIEHRDVKDLTKWRQKLKKIK